jgi:hypothetical protein
VLKLHHVRELIITEICAQVELHPGDHISVETNDNDQPTLYPDQRLAAPTDSGLLDQEADILRLLDRATGGELLARRTGQIL